MPVNNIKAFADKVIYLVKNEHLREEFGRANRRIIQEKAEYEKEMAEVEKAYRRLEQREEYP